MDVVAAVGADEESAAVVEPGEGALDDPAVAAEAGAVLGLAASDDRFDAALPDEAAVLVVVVAAVGDAASAGRRLGRPTRPRTGGTRSSSSSSWVTSLRLPPVSVQASGMPPPSTRRWCLLPRRPRSTGLGPVLAPPFSPAGGSSRRSPAPTRARSAACSSASSSACSRSQTPACCQARNLRHAVIPQPKPSSCGRCSQPIPVCSTNKIPCDRAGHRTACAPDSGNAAASGSNGLIRSHSPSGTSHGFARIDIPPELDDRCRRTSLPPNGSFIELEPLSLGPTD